MGSLWPMGLRCLGRSYWPAREEVGSLAVTIFSLEFLDKEPQGKEGQRPQTLDVASGDAARGQGTEGLGTQSQDGMGVTFLVYFPSH